MQSADSADTNKGLKVLVMEDETLVAINLETILEDLGCTISGPIMRYDEAEALLAGTVDADVAILDVNFGGRPIFPIARELAARNVPLVFATGYDRSGIPEEWHERPILQKPYTAEEIVGVLREVGVYA